jgi:hypothetical protein
MNSLYYEKPLYITNPSRHTMDDSLYRYLATKIHPSISLSNFNQIVVRGIYSRDENISPKEKKDKSYNYQRPTIKLVDNSLIIQCFPGRDYVRHYASLIATYLAINEKDPSIVSYKLPTEEECWEPILNAGYDRISMEDTIIVGYAISDIFPEARWKELPTFFYSQYSIGNHDCLLLMIKHSFWGDISGRIIRLLSTLGCKSLLFIGKLGSLDPDHIPNIYLATGNSTMVEGERLEWHNLFDNIKLPNIKHGHHITIPSVLFETKEWHKDISGKFDFVDPEIGQMARASLISNIHFSYLHIISDNLSRKYPEDLSNERETLIIQKRRIALMTIKDCIEKVITL